IGAVPALGDLDGDGQLEIVVGTIDQKLYVWHADGSRMAPFPIQVFDASSASGVDAFAPRAIIASAAIADVDNDGANEIVISTDETYASPSPAPGVGGSGRAYVIKANGTIAPGWPVKPTSINPNAVPLVAQGVFADIHGPRAARLPRRRGRERHRRLRRRLRPPVLFDHLLSAWNATTGAVEPAFPRVIEDWQFFNGPAVAEISGDSLPEIIESSGGFFVHAFDAAGFEPAGWPKLTGHWQTSTPSIGDLDDDGRVEVVQTTRLGELFVWRTAGATCQADQWRKFRHDEWNTGSFGADTRRPA